MQVSGLAERRQSRPNKAHPLKRPMKYKKTSPMTIETSATPNTR